MLCQEGGGGKSGLEMETVCVCERVFSHRIVGVYTHASAHACVFTHISVYVYACILSQDYMCICTMCIHSRLCMCMHVFSHRITCVYVCIVCSLS